MKSENKLLNNFLLALKSKGRSQNTITSYEIDNIQLLNYIREKRHIEASIDTFDKEFFNSVGYQDLEFYMNYLTQKNKAESSRARKVSSIKEFFKYITKMKVITINPALDLEAPSIPERNPKYKNTEECKTMLQNIKSRNKERDLAIITLFINLGLRVSELVGIDLDDIKENKVRVIRKGNEEKNMRLNEYCIDAINKYLEVRKTTDEKALFISERGTRISVKEIRYLTYKYGNINPHALRHSCFTNLLSTGKVNIRKIQELANHKNIQTTVRYTHITEDEMQETVNANPYY
jgi:site-specific recombinase XerD